VAIVLYDSFDNAAKGQRSHHQFLPRHIPPTLAVRPTTASQSAVSACTERCECFLGWGVPGRSGKTTAQWPEDPEPSFDSDSVILSLRRARGSGGQRHYSTGLSHSKPTPTTCVGRFSNSTGDRSAVGRA